jgi:hypothetical protein
LMEPKKVFWNTGSATPDFYTMNKINKAYLGAAVAVGLCTAGGPFLMAKNVIDKSLLYGVGGLYALIPFIEGSMRIYEYRRNELDRANSRKFCSLGNRLSIEQLVAIGEFSLDE